MSSQKPCLHIKCVFEKLEGEIIAFPTKVLTYTEVEVSNPVNTKGVIYVIRILVAWKQHRVVSIDEDVTASLRVSEDIRFLIKNTVKIGQTL